MKDETRQTLTLLVEKANRLNSYKFKEHVKEVGLGFKGTRIGDDEWEIEFGLPDDQKLDGIILTFRFFYQESESISFSSLSRFFNDPELSSEWKNGVSETRKAYYAYLKGYSEYTVNLFEGHPTRHAILDTVLYGRAAHAIPSKVQLLKKWTADDIQANLLVQEFAKMVVQILELIKYIGDLSERELSLNPISNDSNLPKLD